MLLTCYWHMLRAVRYLTLNCVFFKTFFLFFLWFVSVLYHTAFNISINYYKRNKQNMIAFVQWRRLVVKPLHRLWGHNGFEQIDLGLESTNWTGESKGVNV